MSVKLLNIEPTNNNNEMSYSTINPKLYEIFNNKDNGIINFLLKNENINSDYIINLKEKNIFNFYILYITKTIKFKDINKFLKLNIDFYQKGKTQIILKSNTKITCEKLKILFPKFLNICIFNSYELSKILKYDNKKFTRKLFELIKIYFLNNIINQENLINIIRLQLISCFYKEAIDDYNKEISEAKNKIILNMLSLEIIIHFLLSFKYVEMSKNKVSEFNNIINETMKLIDDLLLNNYNNNYLLSNSYLFYRLIELGQISLDCLTFIIPSLLKVYKFTFNIDYCLNDLSEQFLLKDFENINKKNNNIIAKNYFLYELFKLQNLIFQEEKFSLIPHGFVFNDNPNNGIIVLNNNSFKIPESFSIVISFKLIKENIINSSNSSSNDIYNNKKFTIFSFSKSEEIIDFNIFIENKILKMTLFGKIYELFLDIEYNKNYVLWHFFNKINKKTKCIFYLNDKKIIKENLFYPMGYYDINVGFDNNKIQNNFVGIIGTFILFNKCFIKDENSKNTKFYEENLLGLRNNYEDIIYINYQTEFSNLNSEILKILSNFADDNISRFIEIIISSKSVMSNDFCCCSNKNRKEYKANYFMDKIESQSMITFNAENIDINLNNYNFNSQNCLITYPIHFNNSFDDFINNNGFKFMELELYYFIGIIDLYSTINNIETNNIATKNSKKRNRLDESILKLNDEKELLYYKLQYIFNLFLYCLKNITTKQEKNKKNEINNFFYTLNSLISLISKNGFKIDLIFLSSIASNISLLIEKEKFFNHCLFILEYEFYDSNDEKPIELLFQTLLIYLDEYTPDFLVPHIFEKILDFDRIYLNKNLKDSKKTYSQLIRKYISLILINNEEECFKLYLKKIKDLQGTKKKAYNLFQNLDSNIIEDYISEEPENYFINSNISQKNMSNIKMNSEENEDKKEKMKLILMYKYLRNLYLSLETKNKTYNLFIDFILEREENLIDFFKWEYNYLSEKYEIKKLSLDNKSDNNRLSNNVSNERNDEPLNVDFRDNINANEILYKKEVILELKKKDLMYSELIKSLCIRFIDEITYEENIKNIRFEMSKLENLSNQNSNSDMNNCISSSNIFKSASSYNLITPRKNISNEETFLLNSNQNSSRKSSDINPIESIEEILMKRFEFYYDKTLSPYTFNSFFLLIFRNLSSETKLKYIKNLNTSDKLIFSKKTFDDIKFFISIILKVIERIGEEELDTIFLSKLEFLEYVYDRFIKLLLDTLEYYNDKKDEMKNLIKKIFCKNNFGTRFHLSVLENLKRQKETNGIIVNTEKFFKNIEKNLFNIIDKTLFEFTDPFYFELLFEFYIKDYIDNKNCNFVLTTIQYMIEKFNNIEINNSIFEEKYIKEKIELCHKNILLLIYKIIFFINKRKYLIENIVFNKSILLYLSTFCNRTNLIYLKLLFPIEEQNESNKLYNKKLIIEMLFEILIELYLEFKKISNFQQSLMLENLINDLLLNNISEMKNNQNNNIFNENNLDINNNNKKKTPKHSLCYKIDVLFIKQNNFKIKNFSKNILNKYLKNISSPNENIFSVVIIFLIKLTIYIKKLEEVDKDSTLLNFLIKACELLCRDAQKLQQKYPTYSPLISKNPNTTKLYEDFENYILKDYNLNQTFNIEELLLKIKINYEISRKYACVAFTKEGKTTLFSIKKTLIFPEKKKSFYKKSYINYREEDNITLNSTKESSFHLNSPKIVKINNMKQIKRNSCSTNELKSLDNRHIFNSKFKPFFSKKEKMKLFDYKITPKFLKFFIRNYFSLYFVKLLTYDEDFIKTKKIYYYLYHNEIYDIDNYNLNYSSKLKNRIGNNYVKHFLKKNFNFSTGECFKYSHKCIYEKNFIAKTKNLFPSKKVLEEYDYAHKNLIINKENKNILTRNCELITYEGAVFGDIFIFQNCMLFKSDLENDKRKKNDSIDYACSSMEFEFLEVKKTKIIEYKEIKEVIPRKFLYSWMSLEIFMKNGRSYLFNFFNEITCGFILDFLKNKNVFVIKNVKEYFDKNEYTKKWKDGGKSTYDYLLLLNKYSSRTYNDSNQYPIMPWIFMNDNRIRNFDIPMSVQNENAQKLFLKIPYDSQAKENRWHSNHYSTSAYICYYLMRINPFTDSMIKFQSNNFDIPERQFFDIRQTLILCEKNNNNREPIPELYTIPEVYINLNNNDFGKQTLNEQGRIHNVECLPYADNAYEFVYKFKFMLNNNSEINTKINEWFDFIFGINQYNKDNINGKGLRNFNKYCYGQNINIKKIINNLKKANKSESKIYNEIRNVLGMVISFGQCPFQILTEEHPKRIYTKGVHNILLSSADKSKLNKDEQELFNDSYENNNIDDNIKGDGKMVQKLYDNNSKKFSIIYFRKSLSKNNLYCILNNKEIEIYQKNSRYKEYKYKKKINISKNYLLFKKTVYGYPILKPKYLFCELLEEYFIFCRYLDNSIKLVTPKIESQILLDSFITSVIRINEKEFITGDNKGNLSHWNINLENVLNIKLKLKKKINSNNNSITSILFNERLNIVISADNNTVVIRCFHDFEFLTYFKVHYTEKEDYNNNDELIVDIKLSNYDFIYILINKGNNNYKLKGYSLNGICFGEYEGKITNFELTKEGRILVGLANMGLVNVLDPINFNVLFSRFIISSDDENECLFYHFYFEKPNIIFFGFKDQEGSKIRLIMLNKDEIKYFI